MKYPRWLFNAHTRHSNLPCDCADCVVRKSKRLCVKGKRMLELENGNIIKANQIDGVVGIWEIKSEV